MRDLPVRLGPWSVGPVIGTGETSSVHLCTHADDASRTAAVKILGRLDADTRARFRREAEILASLDHPGIVRVHGIELDEALPYLEMDHVPGQPLSELLADGPLPPERALDVVRQLLEAVVYLHARGVAHRDICPSNLILHEGRAVLVDFGLAKGGGDVGRTSPGKRFGAAAYAPPEWIGASGVDGPVWDTYAVGVVLYEALTGRPAFPPPPDTPQHVRAAKVMAAKRDLPALELGPGWPDDLRSLVRELTAREVAGRVKSASVALERLRALRVPEAWPSPPPAARPSPTPEYRVASGAWTALVALVALGSLALLAAVVAKLAGAV